MDLVKTSRLQSIKLGHFKKLSSPRGIIEFCGGAKPDYTSTYNVDDNSRAALSAAKLYCATKNKLLLELLSYYVGFLCCHILHRAPLRHGYVLHKGVTKEKISEDSLGRLLFASSWILSEDVFSDFHVQALPLFRISLAHYFHFNHVRPVASALCGLCKLHAAAPSYVMKNAIEFGTRYLTGKLKKNTKPRWVWFEDVLTHENARLPHALFEAYKVTGDKHLLQCAEESLNFLRSVVLYDGIFVPVGNSGWYPYKKKRAVYDQQPIDAGSMVECLVSAYEATKNRDYIKEAHLCYAWYKGKNMQGVSMLNAENGGVYDGLRENGVNKNQGAESLLSYLLASASLERKNA